MQLHSHICTFTCAQQKMLLVETVHCNFTLHSYAVLFKILPKFVQCLCPNPKFYPSAKACLHSTLYTFTTCGYPRIRPTRLIFLPKKYTSKQKKIRSAETFACSTEVHLIQVTLRHFQLLLVKQTARLKSSNTMQYSGWSAVFHQLLRFQNQHHANE